MRKEEMAKESFLVKFENKIINNDKIANFLMKLIKLLQIFSKKNTFILFDNLYESHAEAIDTYALFLWLKSNNYKAYYVLYKKNSLYEKLKKEKKLKNIICLNKSSKKSNEFLFKTFIALISTKIVITSFGELKPIISKFLFCNKQIKYVFIPHGIIFFKSFIFTQGMYIPKKYNYFIVSSEKEKEMLMSFGWRQKKLIVAGLPRWDELKKEKKAEKMIFVFFTWRISFGKWNTNFKLPLTETTYYKKFVSLLKNKKLNKLLVDNNIKLVYGFHHSLLDQCREKFQLNENFEMADTNNISQYIKKTNLLITDYSSIAFDFLYLDIPSIFYRLDHLDKDLNQVDIEDMHYSTSKDSQIFNTFYDETTAVNKIEYYVNNNFELEPENIKIANNFFNIKNDICKILTDKLLKL